MHNVILCFFVILILICWVSLIKKGIGSWLAPVKMVEAEVVDKFKSNRVSLYPGVPKQDSCIVVFKTKDRKLSFRVSEYSYHNYQKKEKGTLKYKGSQLISFE